MQSNFSGIISEKVIWLQMGFGLMGFGVWKAEEDKQSNFVISGVENTTGREQSTHQEVVQRALSMDGDIDMLLPFALFSR